MRVDDSQAESSSDGSVHTGPLFCQDLKAKRCTLSHICHHGTLVENLEQNKLTNEREKNEDIVTPPSIISRWQRANLELYLRVPEVDLHDESHSNPRGKGEASCDDDCQPIPLAGAALCEGVFGSLVQRHQIVAGQVRSRGWEALKTSRPQKEIWVCEKNRKRGFCLIKMYNAHGKFKCSYNLKPTCVCTF